MATECGIEVRGQSNNSCASKAGGSVLKDNVEMERICITLNRKNS